jgi:hypothetical protein
MKREKQEYFHFGGDQIEQSVFLNKPECQRLLVKGIINM